MMPGATRPTLHAHKQPQESLPVCSLYWKRQDRKASANTTEKTAGCGMKTKQPQTKQPTYRQAHIKVARLDMWLADISRTLMPQATELGEYVLSYI